jgi:hypothetical protein
LVDQNVLSLSQRGPYPAFLFLLQGRKLVDIYIYVCI